MKNKFSKSWVASKRPGKQRKYVANAPIHIKRKILAVNLEKTLRKKFGKRSIVVRKGDKVKVVRGQWKKKQGKILRVDSKRERVYIEGITRKKMDGSNAEVPIRFSNLQITELNLDDKKRIKNQPKQEVKNGDKNAP